MARNVLILSLSTVGLLLCGILEVHAQSETHLFFEPNPAYLKPASAHGSEVVALMIDTPDTVVGVHAELRYDTTRVRITDLAPGPFFGQNGGTVADLSEIRDSVGTVVISLVVLDGNPWGASGRDTVLFITMEAVNEDPVSVFRFAPGNVSVRDADNHDILGHTVDLQILCDCASPMAVTLALPQGHYALTSIPLDFPDGTRLSDALQVLGDFGPRSWKGYALVEDELVEDPYLTAGSGFWLSTALNADSIRVEGLTPPASVLIQLGEGWNSIGVPWRDTEFPWADVGVITAEDALAFGDPAASQYITQTLYHWVDRSFNHLNDGEYDYIPVESAQSSDSPNGGFIVHANVDCALLLTREAPSPQPMNLARHDKAHPRVAKPDGPLWTFDIVLTSGESVRQTVTLGAWTESRPGVDRRDVLRPPPFMEKARLAVIQEGGGWTEFMRVYTSPEETRQEWILSVASEDPIASLSWSIQGSLPVRYHAYLVDPSTGDAVDMRTRRDFGFALPGEQRPFLVVLDEKSYAGELLAVTPTTVHAITPNPAWGAVSINYQLGQAGMADLRVFDVAGRQVAVLDSGIRDAGQYRVLWEPEQHLLGTGVYFVTLSNGGTAATRRITFVR